MKCAVMKSNTTHCMGDNGRATKTIELPSKPGYFYWVCGTHKRQFENNPSRVISRLNHDLAQQHLVAVDEPRLDLGAMPNFAQSNKLAELRADLDAAIAKIPGVHRASDLKEEIDAAIAKPNKEEAKMSTEELPWFIIPLSGHRPDKLGGYNNEGGVLATKIKDAMEASILAAISKYGKTHRIGGISGLAQGTDTWGAEIFIKLGIPFIGAAPCRDQHKPWPTHAKERWQNVCRAASEELAAYLAKPGEVWYKGVIFVTNAPYTRECMQVRNVWMADHGTHALVVWDGTNGGTKNFVDYAESIKLPYARINPRKL